MAPPALIKRLKDNSVLKNLKKYANYDFLKSLLLDPKRLPITSILIILAEFVLNILIINKVPYTEIDWRAYMQECEGFLNGTTDYSLLKGDTGPLVYPAGFLYLYSILYFITSNGQQIRLAQYIFCLIYLIQMYLVLRLYAKSRKIPPYVLILSAFTSYRIHSIYVLRLFNDPIAILFLYAAINLYVDGKWTLGSVMFSLAVSIKMNILLFAPAVFILYLTSLGTINTIKQLAICATIQLILGFPFLFTFPIEYIRGSFDLSRVFEHKWTVNYRFLSREIFESKTFHISLLVIHLSLLILFAKPCYNYLKSYCRLRTLQAQLQPQIEKENAKLKQLKSMKKKVKKTSASSKSENVEEKLTKDQQKFLDSFEKSLKANSGGSRNSPIKPEEDEKEPESYHIHFDNCIQLVLLPLFLSNFIGVVCARSLHYQFYVWYFHSLPYLAWSTEYNASFKYLLLGFIEYCWNTYPSTNVSSVLLHVCHLFLLFGIGKKIFKSIENTNKLK
ncbi:lethal(2)neighbour of tid protein 2 [Condylostylus longicornis]|uniref:lethal(2)neighbour of tid protein 2 n=1 Tax=Condylostylus longicornis TaxID=2530218 RepID=UPI00244E4232|nr:lethal(2)neighbour of tid protein 2 [Condylostylus longicornis]